MADNTTRTASGTDGVATDKVTYSGDANEDVQLVRVVEVTGAEGSKTVIARSTGHGTSDTGTMRVELPTDGTGVIDKIVTSVVPGTAATNLGKAEDAGHSSGDTGVFMLGVRNDANAAFSGTDLDYTPVAVDSAGNSHVVAHRGTKRVSVQSGGLTTSVTAYTAGDQVGTQFTIAGASRASGGTGRIKSVLLVDVNDIIGAYDVVFSRASITPASDNAAFAISDADALNTITLVQLAGSFDIGNNRLAQAINLDIPYDCSGGTSIYANLITRVGHTFFTAATDLQLIVQLELD